MLKFCALCPHPPIIIPEIGGRETKRIEKTTKSMQILAKKLATTSPEVIIFISPHGLVYPDRINICAMDWLTSSLSQFGLNNINFKFKNDTLLAKKISLEAKANNIKTLLYDNGESNFELDHGIVVPLYFLKKNLKKEIQILPITYSYQNKGSLFVFGEIIEEIAKKSKKKIALIASGDLSHRLIQTAPAGYSESGKEFDKLLLDYIKNKDIQGILEMDDDFIEEAGECGYRSLLILLGAINKIKFEPKVLSYEGPFGVGYAVVNFQLL